MPPFPPDGSANIQSRAEADDQAAQGAWYPRVARRRQRACTAYLAAFDHDETSAVMASRQVTPVAFRSPRIVPAAIDD